MKVRLLQLEQENSKVIVDLWIVRWIKCSIRKKELEELWSQDLGRHCPHYTRGILKTQLYFYGYPYRPH